MRKEATYRDTSYLKIHRHKVKGIKGKIVNIENQETFNDIFDIYGISILSGTLRLGGARSKS